MMPRGERLQPRLADRRRVHFHDAADHNALPQAEAALIGGIEGGQSCFNIHTTMFPGGEIRSQLFRRRCPRPPLLVLGCRA
jgi:hypothetical protein